MGPTWACELCHTKNNPGRAAFCNICKAVRPRNRYGFKVDGKYFICKLKDSALAPLVNVCEVSLTSCCFFKLQIKNYEGFIEDSIIEAILEHKAAVAREEHERVSNLFNSLEIDIPLPSTELRKSYASERETPSSVVSQSSDTSKTKKKKKKKHSVEYTPFSPKGGSLLGLVDPGLSLFDQVMHNATTKVYDPKIGQYISVETTTPHRQKDDVSRTPFSPHAENNTVVHAATPKSEVKKDVSYIDSMKKERTVMKQVVEAVVKRRAEEADGLILTQADLDINRNEWDKLADCALCERSYPLTQMPGVISFKAVSDWKMQHGVVLAANDHRMDLTRLHNAVKLCSFCTQFFDVRALDFVDTQAIQEDVGVADFELKGPLNCSNSLYKNMFRKKVHSTREMEERPLSRIKHRVALEALKLKAQNQSGAARYQFNPKVPNGIVDQEKIGTLLRTKYAKSSVILYDLS
jgi:hypothetical protein